VIFEESFQDVVANVRAAGAEDGDFLERLHAWSEGTHVCDVLVFEVSVRLRVLTELMLL
jgi:hypothetical protein